MRMSQQILFLGGKARGQGRRKKLYCQLIRRVRRLRKRLLRDFERVYRNLETRADLLPSRRLEAESREPASRGPPDARTKRPRL